MNVVGNGASAAYDALVLTSVSYQQLCEGALMYLAAQC